MKVFIFTWLILASSQVVAQESAESDASMQLFQRIDAQDTIKLERDADALLLEDPHDACARLVKGRVLMRRGRLPEAVRQFRLAVESTRDRPRQDNESEPRWETLSLYELAEGLRLVDKTEEQLSVLSLYFAKGGANDEKRNKIAYPGGRRQAEALIKLGRFEEAALIIDGALASSGQSAAARAGWLYTRSVLVSFQNDGPGEAIDLLTQIINAGGKGDHGLHYVRGQLQQARRDEALARADHLASFNARSDASSAAFPARQLALLDLHAGSWNESVEWAGKAWDSLRGKSPVLRQDLGKDMRHTASHMSVLLGYPDLAMQILGNHSVEPPRFGGSLQNKSQWQCWAGVSRWLSHRTCADLEPIIDLRGINPFWYSAKKRVSAALACARITEDVLHHLSAIRAAPLQPVDAFSCAGGDPVIFLTLIRMLGPSVARAMLTQWPLRDCPQGLRALIDAEIAWRSGSLDDAGIFALKALDGISQQEPVLRARAMIILGKARRNQEWIAKAWSIHPAAPLLAGERIPLKSGFSDATAKQLGGLIVVDQDSPIILTIDLESSSPRAELTAFQESRRSTALDPVDPAMGIKRLLLCPFTDGLKPREIASLSGQSSIKSKDGAGDTSLIQGRQ